MELRGRKQALMKRLAALALLVLLLMLSACTAGENGQTIAGELPEILDRIYDTVDVDDATRGFLKTGLVTTDVASQSIGDYLGLADMPEAQAVASEPVSEEIPFFVCLMRISGGTNPERFRKSLYQAVSLACAGAQEAVRVESEGDLVLLVMAENADKYAQAFFALAE